MEALRKFVIIIILSYLICVLGVSVSSANNKNDVYQRKSKKIPQVLQALFSDIAKEILSKSTSNSQVLTLNFTNLLVLMLLKGLLWGASYTGLAQSHKSRKSENIDETQTLISETEILLLLSYLLGEEENKFDCLHRIACENPEKAKDYLNAATMIINAAKFMGMDNASNSKYEKLIAEIEEAVQFKALGGECETKFSCIHSTSENKI